jgi:hypothetical protein
MPAENLFQSFQRLVTIAQRLDALAQRVDEFQARAFARLDRLEDQMTDVRERLARLEMARDADHAQIRAELAQFMLDVERVEFRRSRPSPPDQPSALPGEPDEER